MDIRITCFSSSGYRCQQPHSEKVVVLKSPKPPLVLGAPPRLAYPLVVFMIREMESDELLHPDETVCTSFCFRYKAIQIFSDRITHLTVIYSSSLWRHVSTGTKSACQLKYSMWASSVIKYV